ncbi:MAG TPA: methionine synthase [Nocardioidaceae bacterium]|nr:methionine synthase [Nocardioidaceae bacterium]
MTHRATGVGSMPGDSFVEAMKTVLGELADLPFLVELPERGPHAAMIGRTAAMITDIGIDLQPAGWRLTDASGLDHQRAASLLAQDLDVLEELVQDAAVGRLKVQATGPWTMAASMERPRGDRVLGDHGARRDLAQALAEGLRVHVQEIRRRVAGADVVVQLDEPALPAVLAALIPTASGLGRHRSVTQQEAATAIEWVASAVIGPDAGAEVALHCCAADLPLGVLRETSVDALSFDLSAVPSSRYDELAEWIDSGRALWPGVVPTVEPPDGPPNERPDESPTATELTERLISWWADLGYTDVESIPNTTVTPACGLAGASPRWARSALDAARDIARNLSVQAGKIEP